MLYGCVTNWYRIKGNASILRTLTRATRMKVFRRLIIRFLTGSTLLVVWSGALIAQNKQVKAQEVSDVDGQPVLLRHLPDYDRVKSAAVFATDKDVLANAVGDRPVLNLINI